MFVLNMKITAETGNITNIKEDLIVLLTDEFKKNPYSGNLGSLVEQPMKDAEFLGHDKKSFSVHTLGKLPAKRVLVIGLGAKEKIDLEKIRRVMSTAINVAKSVKAKSMSIEFPEIDADIKELTCAMVEGLALSNYSFDKYKTEDRKEKVNIEKCTLILNSKFSKEIGNVREQIKESVIICNNVASCRNIINENASIIYPENFAKIAKKLSGLKVTVFDEKKLAKLGFGLHLAVGVGSKFPPRLVIIEYRGNPKSKETSVLIGKGITYDTGGYNLKPTGYMETMRDDMSGAACVMYTVKTLQELGVKQNVIALCPMAENCVSDRSYKPGDTFISYSGKTVEIGNTDAEGRLVLSDSIAYSKIFNPSLIIDVATLTGACAVGLGNNVAGMFTDEDDVALHLMTSSKKTGDRIWRLPMYEEQREEIKSDVADITNSGKSRYGGAIQAAMFLKEFVPKGVKWAHLDIAGPAYLDKPNHYNPKMGTGFGVRLLVEFFRQM